MPTLHVGGSGQVTCSPVNTDIPISAGSTFTISTAAVPSAVIPVGVAVTTPADGDFWATPLGLYYKSGGVVRGPFAEAGASLGAWIPATLINGWTNVGGSVPNAAYRINTADGRVTCRGWIQNGPVDSSAFTLAGGFRPPTFAQFVVAAYIGGFRTQAIADVGPSGMVTIYSASAISTGFLILDGVSFYIT